MATAELLHTKYVTTPSASPRPDLRAAHDAYVMAAAWADGGAVVTKVSRPSPCHCD